MKVATMRAIDYWIGAPLCWMATWLVRLSDRTPPSAPPRRILFLKLSEMGSIIVANPAMEKARDRLGAEIFFLIFEGNAESLRLLNTVPADNVVTIRDTGLWVLALDAFRFLLWARRAKIDTVVDMELFSRFTALLTGLSGAARRVGFYRFHDEGLYRGEMLTHRVSFNSHHHMAKSLVAMVNALLEPEEQTPYSKSQVTDEEIHIPVRNLPAAEKTRARALVRAVYPGYEPEYHRILLINANGSELVPLRRWPEENFLAVARAALREWDGLLVLLTGSPAERTRALAMEREVGHPRCRSLAGTHALAALPALYSISTILLTNDSGPAHFSATTAIRSIVLFGPETPKLYGSLGNTESISAELSCSPCLSAANHRQTACDDPVCMRKISVERVLESIRRALHGEVERESGSELELVQISAVGASRS